MGTRGKPAPAPSANRAPLELRLYIAGNAPNSSLAVANLKAICDEHFAAVHSLEIVDLLTEPFRALEDGIVVTPTLLRTWPEPMQRVIGNLSDPERVLQTLRVT